MQKNAETIQSSALSTSDAVVAQFSVQPERPNSLQAVSFDASPCSCSGNDEIIRYSWEFGDGDTVESPHARVQHNFSIAGEYVVRLDVETRHGFHAKISKKVRVGFRLDLNFEPRCPLAGNPVKYSAQAFVNLHAEDSISKYEWCFKDNSHFKAGQKSGDAIFNYEEPGTYIVRVRATNVRGVTEEANKSITIFEPINL